MYHILYYTLIVCGSLTGLGIFLYFCSNGAMRSYTRYRDKFMDLLVNHDMPQEAERLYGYQKDRLYKLSGLFRMISTVVMIIAVSLLFIGLFVVPFIYMIVTTP